MIYNNLYIKQKNLKVGNGEKKGGTSKLLSFNLKLNLFFKVFELKNLLNPSISVQKSFTELEQFFERFKSILPSNLDKTPPKRKFLVSEQKIIEKRKNWVEAIINYLINKYFEK